jgi:hypothetical protein
MSKQPLTAQDMGVPAAIISHTFIRLRGAQTGTITVHNARTDIARVTLAWGGMLMSFLNAQAAQGVLEGLSAARTTLADLPTEAAPAAREPYDQPAIAIDWTRRPAYAVMARHTVTPDRRRAIRWADIYMGPVTFQLLDRAAFHSTIGLLRDAHRTATAVCLDGPQFAADPTADDYRPSQ